MEPVLIAGMIIVNLALISYTIAIITQSRGRIMSDRVLVFLTAGIIFDVTATICMIAGSSQGGVTLHGIIGYTSLAGMVTDTIFSYLLRKRDGKNAPVSVKFNRGTLVAYGYWVLAHITGALIIMMR